MRRAVDGQFIATQEADQLDLEPGFRYKIRRNTENLDVMSIATEATGIGSLANYGQIVGFARLSYSEYKTNH